MPRVHSTLKNQCRNSQALLGFSAMALCRALVNKRIYSRPMTVVAAAARAERFGHYLNCPFGSLGDWVCEQLKKDHGTSVTGA
jgi:hypothetical protein